MDKVVGSQVTVVGGVLTHGRDPETVVEGLAAEGDGLEEFGYFLGTVFGRREVIVGCFASQYGAGGGILSWIVPGEIWRADIHWGIGHCVEGSNLI